jgi:tetratricopeptide (TPR) repeat protein
LPYSRAGEYARAREILEEALRERDAPAIRYNLACVEALAGNADRALEELGAAIAAEERFAASAAADEDFASLRDDPRFSALVGRP